MNGFGVDENGVEERKIARQCRCFAIVDILSTSVALRKGDAHTLAVLDMKKRLADMRSTGVI
ncbi:hypothetical protein M0D69_26065 [Caballeronia sp. SEWSISQ10-4 2]|uniref:hypothetical protein n=1 Tax=Caballeronia sp. SEWSISQ10-4 2 TaxID=2937438 RepID=UPI0026525284|nr:hypothetical protein [Caballeronia sp. SEWSISQ10-4 2]MDN7181403.1 hypothetical protein [Caballeronia sp. SEWSISQ10-4 2]